MPSLHRPLPPLFRWLVAAAAGVVALALLTAPAPAYAQKASGQNKATPRNFTGYGFDQCLTPTQKAMDAWLTHSPFWAVGVYISGNSRACRNQPNLTPQWVRTQLANNWRILPITLGPQASCSTRFPRYKDDPTIDPRPKNNYGPARKMARAEAQDAMAAAKALGIGPKSTLWYDLEAFDISRTDCRLSAMWFLSEWTKTLRANGYVSGVYSSAGSGLKALDDMRVASPKGFTVPDRIWIARWDGVANTSTSYLRSDGWLPGGRMKQYLGDHNETHGGVTINIDSNFLDLGKGSVAKPEKARCGINISHARYRVWRAKTADPQVQALQCLLRKRKLYDGALTGTMDPPTVAAVSALQSAQGWKVTGVANRKVWMNLHAHRQIKLMKYGATGEKVRRLQRALNSAVVKQQVPVTGVFEGTTTTAVKRYQARLGTTQTGVVTPALWTALQQGRR